MGIFNMINFIKEPKLNHYYKIGNMMAFIDKSFLEKGEYNGYMYYTGKAKVNEHFGRDGELIINGVYYKNGTCSKCCLVEEVSKETWDQAKDAATRI